MARQLKHRGVQTAWGSPPRSSRAGLRARSARLTEVRLPAPRDACSP